MSPRVAFVAFVALPSLTLCLTGCGKSSPPQASDPALDAYCGGKRCETFKEASVRASLDVACLDADTGECGPRLYVRYNNGFVSWTEYFDAAGTMVGVESANDKRQSLRAGEVPACTRVVRERICWAGDGKHHPSGF